jgi:SAM-dependent methyltransferase
MHAADALALCVSLPDIATVLDVGSGGGEHAQAFRQAGKRVTTVNLNAPSDVVGDYLSAECSGPFDLVWASHVLEHQRNVGLFIERMRQDCKPGGWLAVTVPPMKEQVVGGHVALFNAGILLYHLVLAGINCRPAKVKTYGYNVSVVVQNMPCGPLPDLACDAGDIEALAPWFPIPVSQGFDGRIKAVNWSV